MLAELSVRGLRYPGLVAILLSLIFAACGSDQGADQTPTISRAAFTRETLEICAQANREILRVYGQYAEPPYPGGKRPTSEKMNEVAEEVVIPARRKQIHRIEALGFPPGQQLAVRKLLAAWEEGIEEGERDRRTLRGDGVRYAFTKALRLADKLGLGECATG
jgi:hypothetical protein